ncbi:Hypothetical predicted protein [Olea europaea subsp. europaea]|uniref:Uncharacterized protein n=1 Tax=Olea europaea subsp. europaea TaxID=158383 RepID=A0A8S0VL25_OLEEU|nr:Hypothetical predicted protein [Olea europaea subsp. europaea]
MLFSFFLDIINKTLLFLGGLQEAGSLASDLKELEEQLSIAHGDKDVATLRSESLASDLKELSDELNDAKSELSTLKEEQLAEALLTMEEEKALWSSKERATVKAFEEKAKSYPFEIALLSKELSEVIFQNFVDYLLNII